MVVQATVGRHKATLSMFSHTNLALIIWQTLSGARNVLVAQPFHRVALIILASIVMHLIYLAFNAIVIGVFRWESAPCLDDACMLQPQSLVALGDLQAVSVTVTAPHLVDTMLHNKASGRGCMQLYAES